MPIKQIVVPNQQSTLRRSLAARCCCRPRFCCTIHNSIYPVPDGKLLLTNTQQQKGHTKSPSSPAKLRRLILLVSRFPANNISGLLNSRPKGVLAGRPAKSGRKWPKVAKSGRKWPKLNKAILKLLNLTNKVHNITITYKSIISFILVQY